MIDYVVASQDHVAKLYPTIVYGKPRLMDLPLGAIIGTWCYSVPGKVRFIFDRSLEVAPGVLPGDLARAWIRDQYILPIKRRKIQIERSYHAPLHARRGAYGECVYVDIRGAYLQILALGYDVEYRLGRYIGATPAPIPPEIQRNKFSYAIAVAMSGSTISKLEVRGREGVFKHCPMNLYSNPCLYALAQDTLNGIGAEMLAVLGEHCVYVNTDGFIVRSGYERFALDIVQSWGFKASVKHRGLTEIRGVASWRVGDHQTRRFDAHAQDFTSPMMDRDMRRWLKTRWVRWNGKLKLQSANDPMRIEVQAQES